MNDIDMDLDTRYRGLVLNTCYEISLLTDPNLFCSLFDNEYNVFSSMGLNDDDYYDLSFILKDILSCNDDLNLQLNLMYVMFNEISYRVDTKMFLDLFEREENGLSFLNISDEKFTSLCLGVNDVKSIIDYESNLEKRLFYK